MERRSDQQSFNATWEHLFKHRPDSGMDLTRLAIIKGVLPSQEGFFSWTSRHTGFDMPDHPDTGGLLIMRLHLAAAEAAFIRDWVDTGGFQPFNGADNCYQGAEFGRDRERDQALIRWMEKYKAFHTDVGYTPPGSDERACLVISRYPEATAIFDRKWGGNFDEIISPDESLSKTVIVKDMRQGPFDKLFIGPWLTDKPRPIPEDFMDYIEGRCDFSAVNAPYNNLQPANDFAIDRDHRVIAAGSKNRRVPRF